MESDEEENVGFGKGSRANTATTDYLRLEFSGDEEINMIKLYEDDASLTGLLRIVYKKEVNGEIFEMLANGEETIVASNSSILLDACNLPQVPALQQVRATSRVVMSSFNGNCKCEQH